MPTITRIAASSRTPNRRRIYVDGEFAVTCHVNVVARLRLREGMAVDDQLLDQIDQAQRRQQCLDAGLKLLGRREHSRAALRAKLLRRHETRIVEEALDELTRMGYLDDPRLARGHVERLRQRHYSRARALAELLRHGFDESLSEQIVNEQYAAVDPLIAARAVAEQHLPRLRRLDPPTLRRRLAGLLHRRGFDHDTVEQVLTLFPHELDEVR